MKPFLIFYLELMSMTVASTFTPIIIIIIIILLLLTRTYVPKFQKLQKKCRAGGTTNTANHELKTVVHYYLCYY